MGFIFDNTSLFRATTQSLKQFERAENKGLKTGANVVKKHIRDALKRTKIKYNSTGKYKDRLIDAVRSSRPSNGTIRVHILGTQSGGSGTYRLRFFEFATERYRRKGLKKPRYLGNLSKYNGFFQEGWGTAQTEAMQKMSEAFNKYIEDAWNNTR